MVWKVLHLGEAQLFWLDLKFAAREQNMGKVINFESARRPITKHAVQSGSAKILVFDGVRHERWVDKTHIDKRRKKRG